MRKAIAIGILGLGLVSNRAAAQTAVEQAQILRDFQASVATYVEQHTASPLFPEAVTATTPLPNVFTLPVAVVFRQLIGQAMSRAESGAVISSAGTTPRTAVQQPFPITELYDFPRVLSEALPVLPAPLEYRLVEHDLVIRDAATGLVVGVLRGATAVATVIHR